LNRLKRIRQRSRQKDLKSLKVLNSELKRKVRAETVHYSNSLLSNEIKELNNECDGFKGEVVLIRRQYDELVDVNSKSSRDELRRACRALHFRNQGLRQRADWLHAEAMNLQKWFSEQFDNREDQKRDAANRAEIQGQAFTRKHELEEMKEEIEKKRRRFERKKRHALRNQSMAEVGRSELYHHVPRRLKRTEKSLELSRVRLMNTINYEFRLQRSSTDASSALDRYRAGILKHSPTIRDRLSVFTHEKLRRIGSRGGKILAENKSFKDLLDSFLGKYYEDAGPKLIEKIAQLLANIVDLF
jgi:hypothetical protein